MPAWGGAVAKKKGRVGNAASGNFSDTRGVVKVYLGGVVAGVAGLAAGFGATGLGAGGFAAAAGAGTPDDVL